MFLLAVALDLLGLLCFLLDFLGIGAILSFVPDVAGLIFIGGWMYLVRGDEVGLTKQVGKRLGITTFLESIPLIPIGDVAPCWTIAVIITIMKD